MLFIVQHCVLLDIEGTTTPASFFSDVLFPYAHDNVGEHLAATYDSEEAQNDINLLRSQVRFFCSHLLSNFVVLNSFAMWCTCFIGFPTMCADHAYIGKCMHYIVCATPP